MKIAVAGLGYVGLSNAVLLAQKQQLVPIVIAAPVRGVRAKGAALPDLLVSAPCLLI